MSRIMVLAGGCSNEREISINTGISIATALESLGDEVRMLDTGRPSLGDLSLAEFRDLDPISSGGESDDGLQLAGGDECRTLVKALESGWKPDLVFIALHGGAGENGTVQALLDWLGIPYTGCGMEASALAMDKLTSKRLFRDAGLEVPEGFIWYQPPGRDGDVGLVAELADRIDAAIGFPAVVKPNREGSSVGVAVLKSREQAILTLPRIMKISGELLLEEYIEGREVTAAILDREVFPLVEIIPQGGLYDYEHKYEKGKTRYECPASLSGDVTERIKQEALLAWELLGCRHLARVDFRVDEDGTPFCLEVNTIPGMTETSLVPMAAAEVDLDFKGLVAEIAELALKR